MPPKPTTDHTALVIGRSHIPPLSALMAFEAAARHASFSRAAEELNLTQGAVSRQIKLLEDRTGVKLFDRVRKRVTLTSAGSFYAAQVRETLARLASATVEAKAFGAQHSVLRLALPPTFGTRWLLPRLPRFVAKHGNLTIHFATRLQQ